MSASWCSGDCRELRPRRPGRDRRPPRSPAGEPQFFPQPLRELPALQEHPSDGLQQVGAAGARDVRRANVFWRAIGAWRGRVRRAIEGRYLEGGALRPPGVFLEATLLGDRGRLENEEQEVLIGSGVFHLLAISGANIAMLALVSLLLCRWLRFSLKLRYAVTALLLLLFLAALRLRHLGRARRADGPAGFCRPGLVPGRGAVQHHLVLRPAAAGLQPGAVPRPRLRPDLRPHRRHPRRPPHLPARCCARCRAGRPSCCRPIFRRRSWRCPFRCTTSSATPFPVSSAACCWRRWPPPSPSAASCCCCWPGCRRRSPRWRCCRPASASTCFSPSAAGSTTMPPWASSARRRRCCCWPRSALLFFAVSRRWLKWRARAAAALLLAALLCYISFPRPPYRPGRLEVYFLDVGHGDAAVVGLSRRRRPAGRRRRRQLFRFPGRPPPGPALPPAKKDPRALGGGDPLPPRPCQGAGRDHRHPASPRNCGSPPPPRMMNITGNCWRPSRKRRG